MKQKKKDDWDDGRVVAPMNGDELPRYRRMFLGKRREDTEELPELSKKERRSMVRGMMLALLPYLIVVIVGFVVAGLLIALWLS